MKTNPSSIYCPLCGGRSEVVDSRRTVGMQARRRECRNCGYRWSTVEVTGTSQTVLRDADPTTSS